MNIPNVSVIIPAYNVESYIETCIQSVIKQSLDNIEIIVINDGSTDSTIKIIEKIALTDNRIIVISQENQGLSCARNAGLQISKGEYVSFVDGDDWIDPFMLEKMYQNAILHNSDVVSCRLQYDDLRSGHSFISGRDFTIKELSGSDLVKDVLLGRNIQTSAAIKIYRRKFLVNNKILFIPKLLNEDVVFVLEIAYFANKISVINKPFYHAIERESSITRNFTEKNIDNILLALSYQKSFLLKQNIFDSYADIFEAAYLRQISFIIFQAAQRTQLKYFLRLMNILKGKSLYKIGVSKTVWKNLPLKIIIALIIQKESTLFYFIVMFLNKLGFRMH